jgi:hypothetical protein
MEQLTRAQLIKALAEYYRQAALEPDEFYDVVDPQEAAEDATTHIFEIAAQQSQGA